MKNQCFYMIFIALATSCAKPKMYQQRINDIPTSRPNFNTEIRFLGQDPPAEPYFEILDIFIVERGSLSKSEIKRRLEKEAIREGIDGIIEVDSWKESGEVSNLFTLLVDVLDDDGETTTVTTHHTNISGRGFMYLESLNNIGKNPEYEYFYKVDLNSDFPNPFFKIEYKLTGQEHMVYPESDKALGIYEKYFQFYSDFHLLKQREMWTYLSKDMKVTKRILRKENGLVAKVCIPKYDDEGRISQVKIINRNNHIQDYEYVNYVYDEKGRISGRVVDIHDGTRIHEEYHYLKNQLAGRSLLINIPYEGQIKLKTSYQYYDAEYLKDYYFNEIANQKKNE